MSVLFPRIRVGDALRHEALAVFPLFAEPARAVAYDLSVEAMGRGTVLVEEISAAGAVPVLAVENQGDVRVLFLEGEELVGARQNRILNTSVLIAARAKSRIPVSCVEQGRWHYTSSHFSSGSMHSPPMLRRVLKASVSKSVRAHRGYHSDQGEVWKEVARQRDSLGAASRTGAMSDTFETHRRRLEEFQENMTYVEGAVGAAVALGERVVAVDLFDKPATCGKVWKRVLSGTILDALEVERVDKRAESAEVARLLSSLGTLPWEAAEAVGEGEEYRAQSPAGDHASALVFDGTVVHGSVICGRSPS